MKTKILVVLGVFGACQIASAGVLYWQVNTGASTVDVNDKTPVADFVQSDYDGWTYAALVHYDSALATGNGTGSQANPGTTAYVPVVPNGSNTSTDYLNKRQGTVTGGASSISSYSSGVFYIELYDANEKVVGRSQALTYSDASNLAQFESLSEAQTSLAVWNGGNTYTAVPEPTSGLLMLLGMAGLALRRRKAA